MTTDRKSPEIAPTTLAARAPPLGRRAFIGGASCLLMGASRAAIAPQGATIRMGMSSPFSGQAGAYGRQMKEGIDVAFAAVNARGGVQGQRLELVALDDGYKAEPAVANTRRLATQEGVFALMGFYGTTSTLAVLPVLDQYSIPLIGTISGADSLRNPPNRHLFHLRASYGDETATIVKHLSTLGISKIAVFYQDDGFGLAGLKGVRDAMAALHLEPQAIGAVPRDSVDVKAAVASISKVRPQAVVMATLYRPTAEFIKQMRAAGVSPVFVALSPVGTDQLISELGFSEARGMQVSQVIPCPWADKLAATREYKRALAQFQPTAAVSYYGFEGYLNARLVIAALDRAGPGVTRERMMSALRGGPFDIGGYMVDFRNGSNAGSRYSELSVVGPDGRILN